MKHSYSHDHVIEQVPPDYYQKGVEKNILQRKWHTGKLNAVLENVDFYPTKILDVGCASGWFLSQIHKKYPKASCFGVDVYDKAISFGKKKYKDLKFSVADAHKLPYKAETFDLVVCTEVLEHVDDPELVIQEMKKVLKKNGKLIIELDSGSVLFSIIWFLWRLSKGGVWNHSHLHSFNTRKLRNNIRKSGMKIVKQKTFNLGMAMVFTVRKM